MRPDASYPKTTHNSDWLWMIYTRISAAEYTVFRFFLGSLLRCINERRSIRPRQGTRFRDRNDHCSKIRHNRLKRLQKGMCVLMGIYIAWKVN